MRLFIMRNGRACCAVAAVIGLGRLSESTLANDAPPSAAVIHINASRPEGAISPLLYGQLLEYMFGCVKGGLHAELLRDPNFEEAPNAIGLPRYWERYPDERNDVANRKAVNTDHARPLRTTIKLVGTKVGPRAELAAITATSPGASNSFTTPDAVAIRRTSIEAGETTTVSLPAASVVLITLEVQP